MIKIISISGSLRKKSFNTALLNAASSMLPEDASFSIFDLGILPLYNDDLIPDEVPDSVTSFRSAIIEADGMLIASPEYNYSITGVLKNALDWASTNSLKNILENKTIAIIGASKTVFGTVRSQLHLRQVLTAANADVLRKPEVLIRRAQDVIRDDGSIQDERTLAKLNSIVTLLVDRIRSSK